MVRKKKMAAFFKNVGAFEVKHRGVLKKRLGETVKGKIACSIHR